LHTVSIKSSNLPVIRDEGGAYRGIGQGHEVGSGTT
jgi:hypothetical protein